MIPYTPVVATPRTSFRMAQARPAIMPAMELPPAPDTLFTGYTGAPGVIETLAVLIASGAAAWIGIRTGLKKTESKTIKAAGWVGGIGAGLIGLLYLGTKSGIGEKFGLPAVRVSPS
jgi:hypothetical protein